VSVNERPNARRLAANVVLGQLVVTLAVALVSAVLSGERAAVSALLGGGISAAASLAMAIIALRGGAARDPAAALRALFAGEAAKVGIIVVLFAVVLKTLKVVAPAMLAGYVATFGVFWIVLAATGSGGVFAARPRSAADL
jgi:ATP synthase protein I